MRDAFTTNILAHNKTLTKGKNQFIDTWLIERLPFSFNCTLQFMVSCWKMFIMTEHAKLYLIAICTSESSWIFLADKYLKPCSFMIFLTVWSEILMFENLIINFCAIVSALLRGLRNAHSTIYAICASSNFLFLPGAFFSYSPFAILDTVFEEIANFFMILY